MGCFFICPHGKPADNLAGKNPRMNPIQMPPETEYFLCVVNRHPDINYCVRLSVDGNDVLLRDRHFKPLYSMDLMNAISNVDGRTGRVKFSGFQQSYRKANYEATSEQNNFITGDVGESFWEFKFYDNEIQMTYNRGGGVVDEEGLEEVIPQATEDQLNGRSELG